VANCSDGVGISKVQRDKNQTDERALPPLLKREKSMPGKTV
jgi:hypothetical protein